MPKTTAPAESGNEFDIAAEQAAKELPKCKTAQDIKDWWKRWYMRAGHKRLGRLLVKGG